MSQVKIILNTTVNPYFLSASSEPRSKDLGIKKPPSCFQSWRFRLRLNQAYFLPFLPFPSSAGAAAASMARGT